MITLVLFEQTNEKSIFFEVPEDWSKFNNVYISDIKNVALENELTEILYDSDTLELRECFKQLASPTKTWDVFIRCGIRL